MTFLGHVISGCGISLDLEKIYAVVEFERHMPVQGIRSFLGLANYYRKFVEVFLKIATPLTRLTKRRLDLIGMIIVKTTFRN